MTTLHNRTGKAVVYINDSGTLYRFSGQPVAYLRGSSVYGFDGKHLGWFTNGWFRDRNGGASLFTSGSSGGPIPPIPRIPPIPSIPRIQPIPRIPEIEPIRPIDSLGWGDDTIFGD